VVLSKEDPTSVSLDRDLMQIINEQASSNEERTRFLNTAYNFQQMLVASTEKYDVPIK
jgi:hypothetical protein